MKIVLVDDHKIVREGLRAILEREKDMTFVGEAADGREALAVVRQFHPDVVIMDVTMPGLNGIDTTMQMTAEFPGVRVIGLSMNSDRHYVLGMLSAGALGYILKNAASDELITAIRSVAAGKTYLSPEIAGLVVQALERGKPTATPSLSLREREVLQLVAEGYSSKEIAAKLGLAVSTVESHRRQLTSKLKLDNVADLTKYAVREGLTTLMASHHRSNSKKKK
jgi:DNA-binding NarL/FixJ family response regulator